MSTAVQQVRTDLKQMEGEFQNVLPAHISPERFQRVAVTALQNNPDLASCSRKSLLGAFMKSAQDGLLPDGREGAIVKFGGDAQWMPMTAGILKKIRNSGDLESLTAEIVHASDDFDYWIDEEGPHIRHRPNVMTDPGSAKLVYALARVRGGGVYVEIMRHDEIEKVRNVSRAKNGGPWKDWWDEMAKKTAIRRLSKRLPMSSDLEAVITRDDEQYELRDMGSATQVRRGIDAVREATQEPVTATVVDIDPDAGIQPEGVEQ